MRLISLVKRTKIWIVLSIVGVTLTVLLVSAWEGADGNTRFGVVAAFIGLVATVVSASLTHFSTKKREIEARHFSEKREAYVGFVNILLSLAGQEKKLQPLEKKMLDLRKGLLFWGSSDFIKIWNLVENPGKDPQSALRNLDMILRWMRADLGHDDSSLQEGDIADFLLKAEDRGRLRS